VGEPVAADEATNWYSERQGDGLIMQFHVTSTLHRCQTKFQQVELLQTQTFGRCLLLDGQMQSSQLDEAMYHEALVQPAMCAHPQPMRVFIGGGGEGATLRETLKHSCVVQATMCDIDEDVVALCKLHLPSHHQGSFDDARSELVFTDAKAYVEANGPWDVIILDLADPLECGPAFALYTQEFYRTCLEKLTPHGILVTQAGPCDLTTCRDVFTPVYATLRSVFPHVFPYGIYIPSFGHEWGFVLVRL
jgi:spermidine synthase